MSIQEFRVDNPDWDDLPDEAIEGSFTFRQWRLGKALDELGHSILEAIRTLPIIRRLFP
jgi:hypothetical protein